MSHEQFIQELTIAAQPNVSLGDVELLTANIDSIIRQSDDAPEASRVIWRPNTVTDFRGRRVPSGAERLSRWDYRHPNEIFQNGFEPWSAQVSSNTINLWAYMQTNRVSVFVGTTRYISRGEQPFRWCPRSTVLARFEYEVLANGGIDINLSFGNSHWYASQHEIAFPGGIRRQFIRSAREYDKSGQVVRIWQNVHYSHMANGVNRISLGQLSDNDPEGAARHVEKVLWTQPCEELGETALVVEPASLNQDEVLDSEIWNARSRTNDPLRTMEGEQEVDGLIRIDAIANPTRAALFFRDDVAWVFAGSYYVKINVGGDRIVYGPAPTLREWKSLADARFGMVDAAFLHPLDDNQAYLFSQDQYVRVQLYNPDRIMVGPSKIVNNWISLQEAGFNRVDAAIPSPWDNNEVFFFSGHHFILAQVLGRDRIIIGPTLITEGWDALRQAGFHTVDMALRRPFNTDHIFFFLGEKYVVVNARIRSELVSGPRSVRDNWVSLREAGFY